jgi:thioredoxin 1
VKLLRFHATWCGPCKRFEPVISAFAEKHGVEVEHVDIDEKPDMAAAYDIQSVPTTIAIIDGHVDVRISGAVPGPVLESRLREFL